ncbi:MAG: UDP-N-acetylmuramate dehydrogenase [Patulibacter sp.]|nr:UDP-N-acetylmuramate dehydrogenase [Patulibacter sp.]
MTDAPVPGLPPVSPGTDVPLGPLTTLGLGGAAERVVVVEDDDTLITALAEADAAGRPTLLLAGGSNLVIGDGPIAGDTIVLRTTGTTDRSDDEDHVLRTVAAGEPWDAVVAASVAHGLSGLECLSGIPGTTGATPIQNVGAYGQEVADAIVAVRVHDRDTGETRDWDAAECGFAYRTSVFKGHGRYVVLSVTFRLQRTEQAQPLRYGELARAVEQADGPATTALVRREVLRLRRGKGMVIDPDDPDTRSAGSFFTNPIVAAADLDRFRARVAERLGPDVVAPEYPQPDGRAKTSAAWLIERAGFARGHARPGAALSSKHTLALTNRGGATRDLLALAHEVADGVEQAFGVALRPEPVFVGDAVWDPRG